MTDDPKNYSIRERNLDDYKEDPNNANRGSERGNAMLDDSLEQVGPGRSIVADGNDYVPAGNKTLEAAKRAGITKVIEVETEGDAIIVHKRKDWDLLSEEDKRARLYGYLDNRVAQINLSWDAAQISADIESGIDLGMMFDPGEMALLIGNDAVYGVDDEQASESAASEEQSVDENIGAILAEKWGTATGQVWEIPSQSGKGSHRIAIGDCRNREDVDALFGDAVAQIAVTSPPYAMQRANYGANEYGGIPEDEYVDWWGAVQLNTNRVLVDGGSFFVNIKPHSHKGERVLYVFDLVLAMKRRWSWEFIDEHCWRRHSAPGKFKRRLKNGFEPVYEFGKPGENFVFEPRRMGTASDDVMVPGQKAESMVSTGDYYNVSHETQRGIALPENHFHSFGVRSVAHSAQYPVGLPYRFIMIYSNAGQIIYDPFLGSGTNIHAAEKARRLSYGVEMLPEHVAVMLEEWALDGYEPVKVSG
ncbi:MAG: DNA modification methylase [Chloroflexota bacterium]